jgi:hypothetical protein
MKNDNSASFLVAALLGSYLLVGPAATQESEAGYWNVTRGTRYLSGVSQREGGNASLDKAVKAARGSKTAILTQFHFLPPGNITLTDIYNRGWRSGHKTNFCKRAGFTSVIPARVVGKSYRAGGWCFAGGTREQATAVAKSTQVSQHGVAQPGNCPVITAYVDWKVNLSATYVVAGYGATEDAAIADSLQRAEQIKDPVDKKPRRVQLAMDCASCTHVDMKQLGWEAGNKTEFCTERGFDGVRPYEGKHVKYGAGGACYIGPACDRIPRSYQ